MAADVSAARKFADDGQRDITAAVRQTMIVELQKQLESFLQYAPPEDLWFLYALVLDTNSDCLFEALRSVLGKTGAAVLLKSFEPEVA